MRTLILFALALFGTAVLADDASAFGKRGRGKSSCGGGGGGCGGAVAPASSCGGCGGTAPGGYAGHHVGYAPGAAGQVVQATDGQFYTQGADGYFYASAPGTSYGSNSFQNVSPAGYSGPSGYAYPAGGVPPLAMPMPRR